MVAFFFAPPPNLRQPAEELMADMIVEIIITNINSSADWRRLGAYETNIKPSF